MLPEADNPCHRCSAASSVRMSPKIGDDDVEAAEVGPPCRWWQRRDGKSTATSGYSVPTASTVRRHRSPAWTRHVVLVDEVRCSRPGPGLGEGMCFVPSRAPVAVVG